MRLAVGPLLLILTYDVVRSEDRVEMEVTETRSLHFSVKFTRKETQKIRCQFCGTLFQAKKSLNRHVRDFHKEEEMKSKQMTEVKWRILIFAAILVFGTIAWLVFENWRSAFFGI